MGLEFHAVRWGRPWRVEDKTIWHFGEQFPRHLFNVTRTNLASSKMIKVYIGRRDFKNRVKECRICYVGTGRAVTIS